LIIERRHTPEAKESLDLLAHNSDFMITQLLSLGSDMATVKAQVVALNAISTKAFDLAEKAVGHSSETRALVQQHLEESKKWTLLITKLEEKLHQEESVALVVRIVKSRIAQVVAITTLLLGFIVSWHDTLEHLKAFWKSPFR
jgi:hypothetical protein